ncbi:ETS translocation variant 2-like [Bolinopsis microptera]|uniref:ETS translocation variant 2-like n=1 Tax=Bolinopsis microptera TaxID=2820187 RepID=UPI003079AE9E
MIAWGPQATEAPVEVPQPAERTEQQPAQSEEEDQTESDQRELAKRRLREYMREFEINRSTSSGQWPGSSMPSEFSPALFRSIFPYSGDLLYAQFHPEDADEDSESDKDSDQEVHQQSESRYESSESGTCKGPRKLYLWQFLLQLIRNPNESSINWTERPPEFILTDPQQVAKLWSEYKGRGCINVDSLCRALRYYYSRNILKRRQGMGRFVYSFSEAALELDVTNTPHQ